MAYLEPVIGGVAAFALGFVWYSALFGKMWQAETGITDEQAQQNMAMTYGLSLLMMIIMSFAVNMILNGHAEHDPTFTHGMYHGATIGLFFCAPATAINYLYQKKSLKLYLIDATYIVAFLALSGGIMSVLQLG